eukprot:gene22918-biopygen13334
MVRPMHHPCLADHSGPGIGQMPVPTSYALARERDGLMKVAAVRPPILTHPPRRGALWPGTTAVVSRTAESEGTDRPRRACCRSSLSLWASCYHGCALHGMTGGGSTFFIGSAPRRRASGDYSMQRKRRPSPPPSSEACTCVPTLPVSATGGAAVLDHGQRVSITGNVHGHAKRVRGWTTGKPRLLEAPDGWKNVWMQMSAPQSAHNAPKSLPPPDHGAHRYQAWGA